MERAGGTRLAMRLIKFGKLFALFWFVLLLTQYPGIAASSLCDLLSKYECPKSEEYTRKNLEKSYLIVNYEIKINGIDEIYNDFVLKFSFFPENPSMRDRTSGLEVRFITGCLSKLYKLPNGEKIELWNSLGVERGSITCSMIPGKYFFSYSGSKLGYPYLGRHGEIWVRFGNATGKEWVHRWALDEVFGQEDIFFKKGETKKLFLTITFDDSQPNLIGDVIEDK